ncbi:MAG TPA: hypothetical protein VMR77_01425 [Patescibacteria group bacterium]|nr:hypothetical protein [Patescibacteria group bacterium]
MFDNYLAQPKDIEAIEQSLKTTSHSKLRFIFREQKSLNNSVVISYDSCFLYLWARIKLVNLQELPCSVSDYHFYKIPHKIKIKDDWQMRWVSYLPIAPLANLLPKELQKNDLEIPKISGGLLTPFISLQKKKNVTLNPYVTYNSYCATIVHEFGHIYYRQHRPWWYSDKKENLTYLKMAESLSAKENVKIPKIKIKIPYPLLWSEIFAFCTEYCSSDLFWPDHKKLMNRMISSMLKKVIKKEGNKNLDQQSSIFEEPKHAHLAAAVFGEIIIYQYPNLWPRLLLTKLTL